MRSRSVMAVRDRSTLRRGWVADAILAGFVGTGASSIALIIAYVSAAAIGRPDADIFRYWLWQLTNNEVVSFSRAVPAISVMVHAALGLAWALLYARFFEWRLRGPGWRRGMTFAVLPWLVSIFALLPAAILSGFGVGPVNLLEFALSAGWLPIIGNLVLHMVYGAVLGAMYHRGAGAPDTSESAPEAYAARIEQEQAVQHAEGGAARGIVFGVVVGAVLGAVLAVLIPPQVPGEAQAGWSIALAFGGLLAGGAVGAIIGSFAALPTAPPDPREQAMGPDTFGRMVASFSIPLGVALGIIAMIVLVGSILLGAFNVAHDAMVPVYLALGFALVVFGAAIFFDWRAPQDPPSPRDAASHEGH